MIRRLPQDAVVFIHYDKRSPQSEWAFLRGTFAEAENVRFVARHACRWGDFGIVAATLQLIFELVASGLSYDYANLISGADYPIKSETAIREFLRAHYPAEHIEAFDLSLPNRWSRQRGRYSDIGRYYHYHLWFRSRAFSLFRRSARSMPPLFGGSQWWCLTRACVEYVADYVKKRPTYAGYYRHTFIPDESFFNTLVANSPFSDRITSSDLVFSIWDRPAPPFPATLMVGDFDALRATPKLYARKFDITTDADILDLIDTHLLQIPHALKGPDNRYL